MELTAEKRKKLTFWIVGVVAACILIFLGVQNIGVVYKAVNWSAKPYFILLSCRSPPFVHTVSPSGIF